MTYGRAIHALRRFTQASMNKEPAWRGAGRRAGVRHGRRHRGTPSPSSWTSPPSSRAAPSEPAPPTDPPLPNLEAKYRTLVEQLPAVVFMAYLDRGIGEAYVSPRIEEVMGFSQAEWLEDPVRWYHHIHPDDRERWSIEAAEMFLTGKPLRSAYRVLARDGRVVWFQCEVKMVRRDDGRPWFIHGVGFDITELKGAEAALEERAQPALGHARYRRRAGGGAEPGRAPSSGSTAPCECISGYSFPEVQGRYFWDLFPVPDESRAMRALLRGSRRASRATTRATGRRGTAPAAGSRGRAPCCPASRTAPQHIITTGIDITERKRMETALLEVGAREQRQIGQDLHDGLGQHLTGIAFMSKVLEQQLAEERAPQAAAGAGRSSDWSTRRSTRPASWRAACCRSSPMRKA